MNKLGKKLAAGLCICLATLSLSGCNGVNGSATVATLGEEKITLDLANFMLRYNQAGMESSYGAMFGDDMWNMDLGSGTTYGTSFKSEMLNNLKELLILEKHASEYNVTVTEEEKEKILAASKQFMEENSEEVIKTMTASQEVVERMLTLYTNSDKMREEIIKDVDTNVTDEEAKQSTIEYVFFSTEGTTDEAGATVEKTDEEKAETKAQAQKVLDAVKGGTEMDAAAKEVDENKAPTTSSYGTDDTSVKEELKTAATGLKDGEVAEKLVEADTGFYVVKMKSEFDKEATESRKETIASERKNEKYDEVYTAWQEAETFKVEDGVWAKVTFDDKYKVKETETESAAETETGATTETTKTTETTETQSETQAK